MPVNVRELLAFNVQMLLNKGANVNATGVIFANEHARKGGTALDAAELAGHPEVVALLKKARQD